MGPVLNVTEKQVDKKSKSVKVKKFSILGNY